MCGQGTPLQTKVEVEVTICEVLTEEKMYTFFSCAPF